MNSFFKYYVVYLELLFVAQKVGLGVASFGVSVTTMEEVFIKVVESTTDSHTKR